MSERLYDVRFYAYTGMSFDMADGVERDEALAIVKARIARKRREGYTVVKLEDRANTWEVQERDDCAFQGDETGLLVVERTPQAKEAAMRLRKDLTLCFLHAWHKDGRNLRCVYCNSTSIYFHGNINNDVGVYRCHNCGQGFSRSLGPNITIAAIRRYA